MDEVIDKIQKPCGNASCGCGENCQCGDECKCEVKPQEGACASSQQEKDKSSQTATNVSNKGCANANCPCGVDCKCGDNCKCGSLSQQTSEAQPSLSQSQCHKECSQAETKDAPPMSQHDVPSSQSSQQSAHHKASKCNNSACTCGDNCTCGRICNQGVVMDGEQLRVKMVMRLKGFEVDREVSN
eukprot:gene25021-31426_t